MHPVLTTALSLALQARASMQAEMVLKEAEAERQRKRIVELEEMQKRLQEALQQEVKARQDEESVRYAQARCGWRDSPSYPCCQWPSHPPACSLQPRGVGSRPHSLCYCLPSCSAASWGRLGLGSCDVAHSRYRPCPLPVVLRPLLLVPGLQMEVDKPVPALVN